MSRAAQLDKLAHVLTSGGSACRIGFLFGAGASVCAGIPDFRSPGGMYDTLRPELLTASDKERRTMAWDPTAVVSWSLFQHNPLPYLEVRRPFILGTQARKWKPTITHVFTRLCYDKGMLQRLYTQNIDGLDYHIGLPEDRVVPAHGSIARVACESCRAPYPADKFCEEVSKRVKDIYKLDPSAPETSRPVECLECGSPLVKPATVLYGRELPARYFEALTSDVDNMDVLFIVGTSLTVYPCANIPNEVNKSCRRVLVNKDPVSQRFTEERDSVFLGECDETFLDLIEKLGWLEDLRAFRDELAPQSQALLDARTP